MKNVSFGVQVGSRAPYVSPCSVCFDENALAEAAPGTYTGSLHWSWVDGQNSGSGDIPLTLTVPEPGPLDYVVKLETGKDSTIPQVYSQEGAEIFRSLSDGAIAASREEAQPLQFYYESDGGMGFYLPNNHFPGIFYVPEGIEFDGWMLQSDSSDNPEYVTLTRKVTVFIAKAKVVVPAGQTPEVPASISILFGETQTAFDFRVESCAGMEQIDPDTNEYGFGEQCNFSTSMFDGTLTNAAGGMTIPYQMTSNGSHAGREKYYFTGEEFVAFGIYGRAPYVCQCFINIDADVMEEAPPGVYTGSLHWIWHDAENSGSGDIPLTLTVPPLSAEEQAAVDTVIGLINAIGTVEYNAESKTKIDAARDAYDALTGRQQSQVTNFETLTSAEAAYKRLSFRVAAHSLTLDGDIGVNFYVDIPDVTEDAYAEFTVDGETVTVPIDLNKTGEMNGLTLYKFTCNVAAAQIDTEITGKICNGDAETDSFAYTVQDYLTEAMNTMADDAAFMALAGSLATYGYYANELFAFNPAFVQHALFDDSGFAAMTAASLADCAAQINDTADGVIYYGSSLVLRTETAIRHYFTLPAGKTIDEYTFLLGEGDDAVALTPKANGNYYYVEIPNIPSAKLGDPQTVTAIKNTSGAGGTAVGGVIGGSDPGTVGNGYNTGNVSGSSTVVNTWTYSALSYVFKVLTKAEANDPAVSTELINVSKALTLYYQAAEVFFSAPEISFRLTDNFGWAQAYVYAWDADGNAVFGEYPGQQAETTVNEYGETQFVIRLPADAVGCFVSNGNGTRTEDITDFSYTGYWMDGNQNVQGHYLVTGWY